MENTQTVEIKPGWSAKPKKALICGISGQDGSYLAKHLLDEGRIVYGTSRDAQVSSFSNLARLEVKDEVSVLSMAVNDFRSVLHVLTRVEPDEVYNLAGQSSVGLSFEQPVETMESIGVGTLNMLEAIRFLNKPIRFYNACSSECFGNTVKPADENSPFRPRSPYAVAKSASFWEVANYRESYGLFACSGILFNHESPLRPERFVCKKIITTAVRIYNGSREKLLLGRMDIMRDWGFAPEYVKAMRLMLERDTPEDFVIATGETNSLQDFTREAFAALDLDWRDHVESDNALFRPSDIAVSRGNPAKAAELLGWEAWYKMRGVVKLMIQAELEKYPA